jgi:addiction module HigA family antidote
MPGWRSDHIPKRDPDEYKISDPAEMAIFKQAPVTVHPGIYLRDTIMRDQGLKVAPTAKALGISRRGLLNVLEGSSDITRDLAYKFGAYLGDHVADFLINHQNAYDIAREREKREAYKATIAPRVPVHVK